MRRYRARDVSVLGGGQSRPNRQWLQVNSQMAVHLTGEVDQTHQGFETPAGDAACVKELAGRRLDFVPDVLGRLPVSCLWMPKDAQPLESRLRVQVGFLEIDLEPHDRESLEGSMDMMLKDLGRWVPEDNIVEISEDIDPLEAKGAERPVQDLGENVRCHIETEGESSKKVELVLIRKGKVPVEIGTDGNVRIRFRNVYGRHVGWRKENLSQSGMVV